VLGVAKIGVEKVIPAMQARRARACIAFRDHPSEAQTPPLFAPPPGLFFGGGAKILARERQKDRSSAALSRRLRIPTKPATHSDRKPATCTDLKPAGIPI
jgi:hypothetical protein